VNPAPERRDTLPNLPDNVFFISVNQSFCRRFPIEVITPRLRVPTWETYEDSRREEYVKKISAALEGTEPGVRKVVFLDPDTGMQPLSPSSKPSEILLAAPFGDACELTAFLSFTNTQLRTGRKNG
jgi:hypothetical protein